MKKKTFLAKRSHRFRQGVQIALFVGLVGVIFATLTQLPIVQELLSRASGQPAQIVIDVNVSRGPLQKPWQNLAQGGESHNWNLQPLVAGVRELQPQYIRIDHIYSFYEIVSRPNGQLSFNFSKLDPLLDSIKATGATPYISLSYMPQELASSDIVSPPKNWNEYQLLIQRTIEHISGTRGFQNVYYEVWNEPDLFGGWKTSGERNYLTLYTYAARGASAARNVQPFKFGGPGITAAYRNWFNRLSQHAIDNNLRYDFFSWHRYNLKPEQFVKDYDEVESWRAQFPQLNNLELMITEWGHDSANHPGYDGNFGAAHTAAVGFEMVGRISKGFVFEIEDGKDPAGKTHWGRWGLYTNQNPQAQPKPRYHALKLMNQLQGQQLQLSGNGTWVKALASKTTTGTVQIGIANFDPAGRNSENVPITLQNLLPGEYQVKQTFLGGRQNVQTVTVDSTTYPYQILMPASSVALIEFIPQFEATNPELLLPFGTNPSSPLPETTPRTGFGRLLEN